MYIYYITLKFTSSRGCDISKTHLVISLNVQFCGITPHLHNLSKLNNTSVLLKQVIVTTGTRSNSIT